jgi:glycosyltransferase involved in cell wall biosynthesis
VQPGGKARDCDVLAIGREVVCETIRATDTSWIEQVVSPAAELKVLTQTVTVPRPADYAPTPGGTVITTLLVRILSWRASPFRAAADRSWIWRQFSAPPPHSLYFNVRAAFGGEVVYPWPPAPRNIGFVLPIASFGGVERVAYNLAREFTAAGWRVHLFVVGSTRIEMPREFAGSFTSINFLNDAGFDGWDENSSYQGTALPGARNNPKAIQRIEAALAWLDAVVNCHCGQLHAAAANLRRLGVKTVAHIHLLDLSPFGRSVGYPMIALAYEYAYDLVLTTSRQLTSWMNGAGIPYEKLLHVPNAPGYRLEAATREQILARRGTSRNRRLNALYIGRLDRQKGIDRLADVVKQTQDLDLPIDWRIVGSRVTDDFATPPFLKALLEPAAFDGEELTSLYAWADVMILLSDYEGVPLSVLEAQRLGVIVIATDVGALQEIVSSGKTGFLVHRERAVEEAIGLLTFLLDAPELRSRIAEAASRVAEWRETAAEFIERVTALVDAGRPTKSLRVRN